MVMLSPDPLSCSIKFFSCEDTIKHRRGPCWSWTCRWRRKPNGIFLSFAVQSKCMSSYKKLTVRTKVSIGTVRYSRLMEFGCIYICLCKSYVYSSVCTIMNVLSDIPD